MKLNTNRCGRSAASTDTSSHATTAKPVALKPATSSRPTSAGQIIPAYLKSDQTALIAFVRQYMSFLQSTSLNRMIKAIEKPQNKLFNRLYPEILNTKDGSYICLSNDLRAKGKSQRQIESAIKRQIGPSELQEKFPYFTNLGSARGVVRCTSDRRPWRESPTAVMWC
jgi:hypothetical protein